MRISATTPISASSPVAETNPAAAAAGATALASDAGHRHAIASPATPTTQALGDAATSGAGAGFATDTHKHAMPLTGLNAYAVLAADMAKTTDVALANITGAAFAIGASETWQFEYTARVSNTANGCAAIDVTGPAAPTTVELGGLFGGLGTIGERNAQAFSSSMSWAIGAFAEASLRVWGTIVNGASAGTVQVRFAEGNSAGTATLRKGGTLRAWRIS